MLKRIYIGGSNTQMKAKISFIILMIFVSLNITYVILGLLMILFDIFSLICAFEIFSGEDNGIIITKIFLKLVLNFIIFCISAKVLALSVKLSINLNYLSKELIKFNNVEEIGEKDNSLHLNELKYINIEGNVCLLKEVISDKLQKHLYYSLDNDDQSNKNFEVLNINNNNINNIKDVDVLQIGIGEETHDRLKI